jgi:hypothetical protein
MAPPWRHTADGLVADLHNVFGDRLLSVLAYGPAVEDGPDAPLTCLALIRTLRQIDLDACAKLAGAWTRQGLAIPLILPEEEFQRSLDAFPLEYSEIARAHQQLYGSDPFERVRIAREDLRRACETQIKSHLVHLREGFIEAGGRPQAIAALVSSSAPAFAALLRNVARLTGSGARDRVEATRAGALAAGLPEATTADVLALENPGTMPATDPARLFPDYLLAVEQLARAVDTWRA